MPLVAFLDVWTKRALQYSHMIRGGGCEISLLLGSLEKERVEKEREFMEFDGTTAEHPEQ